MSVIEIVLIALALSADAFAVSVTSGIAIKKMKIRHAMLIAAFFGGFQALMPVIGWAGGRWAQKYIESFDHWIAFVLLCFVGGKMIYEAVKGDKEENESDPLNVYVLFILAIATSIDALAVGLSLAFIKVFIIVPALIIGCITFALSFAGTYIGNFFGHLFEKKIEIAGGVILIGIGCKILIEHLLAK